MASIFDQTITPELKFSNFPLNKWNLSSQNFGQLVPVYVKEVLPNDVFTLSAFMNIDFAPMVAPMFQEVNASIHFFYCPERTLWDDFETFITGSEEGHVIDEDKLPTERGLPKTEFNSLLQQITGSDFQGTIFDYLGLPNNIGVITADDEIIDDSPWRAYFKIWYDYYRDENLQVEVSYTDKDDNTQKLSLFDFWRAWRRNSNILEVLDSEFSADSPEEVFADVMNHFSPFYRAFKKDYFTAALPTPQKGEEVKLSLGDSAPVLLDRLELTKSTSVGDLGPVFKFANDVAEGNQLMTGSRVTPSTNQVFVTDDNANVVQSIVATPLNATTLTDRQIVGRADLTKARAITVEALREAFAVQEILESLSVRGSRFTEFLRGNFGVTPDDARLQRPQFIGGIVSPVAVQKVLQTSGYSGIDSRDMTGYQAGRAFVTAGERVFRMRFKEHGWIIGIASVMPKAYYYQGIPRHYLRHDRFDYYLPQTAHLGEQGIENQELFYSPADAAKNKKIFGYIPRWAEYKTDYNEIHGDFRGSLNYYHMARVFATLPTLSAGFISTEHLQTRPFAVWQTENPNINHLIWAQFYFKVTGSRPMPYYSLPKIR